MAGAPAHPRLSKQLTQETAFGVFREEAVLPPRGDTCASGTAVAFIVPNVCLPPELAGEAMV